MKILLLSSCLLVLSTSALAKHTQWYDEAKVINVTPVYHHDYYSNRYDDHFDDKVIVKHNNDNHRGKIIITTDNKHHNKRRNKSNRVIGYNVSYKYRGQVFDTFTEQHPGNYISVKLNIEPLVNKSRVVVKQYRHD
ncbi:hypothetical protein [Pseudoalteromonas tunicata]|jgi:hypothetical protein|uniref:Orphan protein n=1 Tax=Pseudoalteromonas tunicata D2 TaxID=87626 RepID=A4CBJ0_9GAMM|nr:hypothetical protein [Pseudoalteromonas tunicata]ATC94283.1 hypothetical protein PTUN_a1685 [Pseudoalteromonas tunicata]AXT30028.1 hypothetical protein D1819_03925 [Pseudoalteromonas tunicata]EAR27727.1 hypothetical protein PTD2_17935 [Pseudoalteromonas tunicata D2]MDP4982080.1 hypothetical protein [Pseudoalteromonas tunicata]MDP5211505.1 hypothetical protein [Pseudoalteromonas tunicata]